jgi:hypothetical protein
MLTTSLLLIPRLSVFYMPMTLLLLLEISPVDDLVNKAKLEFTLFSKWFAANRLALNARKSKFVVFKSSSRIKDPDVAILNFDGMSVSRYTSVTYLGVILDDILHWNLHINAVSDKVSKGIGILKMCSKFMPIECLISVYNAFILPYLSYCLLLWGNAGVTLLSRINVLQKRAIRLINCAAPLEHCAPLAKSINVLFIDDLFSLAVLCFMHNVMYGESVSRKLFCLTSEECVGCSESVHPGCLHKQYKESIGERYTKLDWLADFIKQANSIYRCKACTEMSKTVQPVSMAKPIKSSNVNNKINLMQPSIDELSSKMSSLMASSNLCSGSVTQPTSNSTSTDDTAPTTNSTKPTYAQMLSAKDISKALEAAVAKSLVSYQKLEQQKAAVVMYGMYEYSLTDCKEVLACASKLRRHDSTYQLRLSPYGSVRRRWSKSEASVSAARSSTRRQHGPVAPNHLSLSFLVC